MTPLPPLAIATFAALTLAAAALWAPRVSRTPLAASWWVAPFAATLLVAQVGGLLGSWGLGVLAAIVLAARLTEEAPHGALKGFAIAALLALSAGVLAHAFPGFANPKILDGVRLGPDAAPYTKYLNLDKGLLGLFLLGLVAPARTSRRSRVGAAALVPPFLVMAAVVMAATVAFGFARLDPKLPGWWPVWLWSMLCLTALPEEAVFRHFIQGGLEAWLGGGLRGRGLAAVVSGVLFGLAHAGGGPVYVLVATLAGIGYGWIYAVSGSVAASILAHTGLNLLHLLCFTYPALDRG
jgi:membrane protease YdiL (CAAX protease family)